MVSALRVYCRTESYRWLSDAEAQRLKLLTAELKMRDRTPSRRRMPLSMKDIIEMAKHWDLNKEDDLRTATMFTMAHQGLLRGGELLSGLKASDVEWESDNEFRLLLWRTKTVREGDGDQVYYRNTRDRLFAGNLLRKWFDLNNLWNRPHDLLFPSSRLKEGKMRTFTGEWFNRLVKIQVRRIGKDPTRYGGHSFRAGGATDLFALGVDYPSIKKFGRWTSDVALRYYRDQGHVEKLVAKAFGKSARKSRLLTTR